MIQGKNRIREQLNKVRSRIAQAAKDSGRLSEQVTLVAATKTRGAEEINMLFNLGVRCMGENRLKEALDKRPALSDGMEHHFIGTLQKNKVRKILAYFSWIHTIDSQALYERCIQIATEEAWQGNFIFQINVSNEPQKGGFSPEAFKDFFRSVKVLEKIKIRGLMTVPSLSHSQEKLKAEFEILNSLVDWVNTYFPEHHYFKERSMGMSNDFELAIKSGSTMIRLGTLLFGPRE